MTHDQEMLETFRGRLDRLERDHRGLRRAVTLALVGGTALLLMGQAADQVTAATVVAMAVEAQSLVIRDATGKIRALLDADPAGPSALTLSDSDGRERLALGIGPAGGVGLVFRGKEGQTRAAVGVGPQGRPFFMPRQTPIAAGD